MFLPVHSVLKAVVRRVTEDRAEADRQREEALRDGGVPDGGLPQGVPFRRNEEENTLDGTLEGHSADQQGHHHHVREYREEVGSLTGALHAAAQHPEDAGPAEKQAYRQLPRRLTDAVLDGLVFLQDYLPESRISGKARSSRRNEKKKRRKRKETEEQKNNFSSSVDSTSTMISNLKYSSAELCTVTLRPSAIELFEVALMQ